MYRWAAIAEVVRVGRLRRSRCRPPVQDARHRREELRQLELVEVEAGRWVLVAEADDEDALAALRHDCARIQDTWMELVAESLERSRITRNVLPLSCV